MSTAISPLEHYLHETWSPDREFVDGEIVERNLGEKDHSAWQVALIALLRAFRLSAHIRVYAELRLQVSATRYRIPDVMLTSRSAPDEQIITHPPLLCVEILSPEDRFHRMEEKVGEYLAMGVRAVWIIDPKTQTGYQCLGPTMQDWQASPVLTIPGTSVSITVAEVAADLD
ncbi:Uma2 family endonuclease [Silvibacterium dinghuense]|uniref:Uma2 family endonuclease n=1 Tax=Silvibacterium dinghuense TaxID=1560006 RepID=A0A4Q1SH46_9BACT|nr:Uma2 family endonuclease [Silvibacterium dinghuense]RXS96878.1 Uma2 family endonuclease [Silvibacterium dinghuense]GGG94387.1 hypothetical protein GCM10011586_06590 [Silvibacterium dinghuense]